MAAEGPLPLWATALSFWPQRQVPILHFAHALFLRRGLVAVAEQVQQSMHHHTLQFRSQAHIERTRILADPIIAHEYVAADAGPGLSIECDHIGVFVMIKVPAIEFQQGIIAHQNIIQLPQLMAMIPRHRRQPLTQCRPVPEGGWNPL